MVAWEREGEKQTSEGFTQVKSRRRGKNSGGQHNRKDLSEKSMESNNPFQVLEQEGVGMGEKEERNNTQVIQTEEVREETKDSIMQDIMEEDEAEEMELGDLDMDVIEEEYEKVGNGYVPREQIELLQKAIINSKARRELGISVEPQKGSKRKSPKEEQKRGRKSNKQRIAEIGVRLIESGQYSVIQEAFFEVSKFTQWR